MGKLLANPDELTQSQATAQSDRKKGVPARNCHYHEWSVFIGLILQHQRFLHLASKIDECIIPHLYIRNLKEVVSTPSGCQLDA